MMKNCWLVHLVLLLSLFWIGSSVPSKESVDNVDDDSGSGVDDDVFTFTDIITLSVRQLLGTDSHDKDSEILNKHFFTDKKNMSIWPKVIEETEEVTNVEFEERELADMENSVTNIYRRILECDLNNAGQKDKEKQAKDLVMCYKTLGEYITDGFVDFSLPRGAIEGHAHMYEMNIAYNVMVLLLYHMISGMSFAADMVFYDTDIKFYKVAEEFSESMKIVTESSINVRLSAISPIEICEIQEVLWQEFPGQCESRSDESREKRSIGTTTTIFGIGGSPNIFGLKYRATVTDEITGENICFAEKKSKTVKFSANVKNALTKKCSKERQKYTKTIKDEITEYYNERSNPVTKDLPKLWGSDILELAKKQKELEKKAKNAKKKKEKKTN